MGTVIIPYDLEKLINLFKVTQILNPKIPCSATRAGIRNMILGSVKDRLVAENIRDRAALS